MSIKTPNHQSGLEAVAYEQRLESLGLKRDHDGSVTDRSMGKVETSDGKSGADAVAAVVGADGVLSAEAASQLKRTQGVIGAFFSKDVPSAEAQSNAVRSVALACDGLCASLRAEMKQVTQVGIPGKDVVAKLERRNAHLTGELDGLMKTLGSLGIEGHGSVKGNLLGQADPTAVHQLAKSLGELGGISAEMSSQLSAVRDIMMMSADGPSAADAAKIKDSLSTSASIFGRMQSIGALLGDQATYTLNWLLSDDPEFAAAGTKAPSEPPKSGRDYEVPPGRFAAEMERTFPGIHDPYYGMSGDERAAWEKGGSLAQIAQMLGRG